MRKVIFKDVVKRVNINVDRHNTERLYYVGGEHIDSDELLVTKHGLIKGSTIGFKFHFGFNPGHILFMSRNPHLRKASMATFEGICSDSTYVVETRDNSILLQEYLLLEMQSDRFWNWAEANKSGGVNYLINYKTLDTYEFTIPSIVEQKVLTEKLWAAYEVKQSYLKMIDATEELVKAKFINMFNNCPQIKMGDYFNIEKGTTITRSEAVEGEIPVIAGGKEPSCYHNISNRIANMVTISASGAYAGFVNFWPYPIFASDCNTIYPKDVADFSPFFLYKGLLTKQQEIYNLQKGGLQPHVYGKDLMNFLFPKPSQEMQRKFVVFAEQADNSKIELRKSIDAIDKVIKSLINENL